MPTVCSVKYGEIMCLATCLQNNAKICQKNNFRIHVGFLYYLKVVWTAFIIAYYLGPFFSYPPVAYRAIIQYVLYGPSILFVRTN